MLSSRCRLACGVLTLLATISGTPSSFAADEARAVTGSWSMSGRPLQLAYAVAYETTVAGDPGIAVLASNGPLNVAAIKAQLAEKKKVQDVDVRQPHVKVLFRKSGEIASYYATASGFTTNGNKGLTGELKREGDRVSGRAALESQGEGTLQRSFDFQFTSGLIGTTEEPAAQTAPLAKLGVSGTFKGNKKEAKLAFVSARDGEPFGGKPGIVLIFTEKDHSRDPRPAIKAGFGEYGSALIVSCHEDGAIFGCEVAHAAHEKTPFSTSGTAALHDFQIAGGQVQGRLSTDGEQKFFDQTWEIDLQFAAPFKGVAKSTEPTRTAAKNPTTTPTTTPTTKPSTPPAASKSGEKLKAQDLAILEGAKNVEFKKLVEQITYQSSSDLRSLAAQIDKQLQDQGWTKDGSDLVAATAILKRKRGSATLTIIVKPVPDGSSVVVMTKGLSWEP